MAEYNAAGTLMQRYLHGSAAGDDPIAWLAGSSVTATSLRHLLRDERGSIVAITGNTGTLLARNSYDAYGIPATTNAAISAGGRFQYTGQAWIPEIGMYHYKARTYSPTLGRFLQTDPIGYNDAPNLYAYVGNDPVNAVDPTGMYECAHGAERACDRVDVSLRQLRGMIRSSQIYEHGLRRNLRNSLEAAGRRGDNGAVVTMGVREGCNEACAFVGVSERRIVVYNPTFVERGSNARFAGTTAHEFGHIYDFTQWGNNNPQTFQDRYDTERRYTPLGVVIRSILGESPSGLDAGRTPEDIGRRHGAAQACGAYRAHERRTGQFPPLPCPIVAW